ncbi:MAG TPA: hypothetical protein PLY86_03800 [bacterium]|nr:hypothetical protein [bacterium]
MKKVITLLAAVVISLPVFLFAQDSGLFFLGSEPLPPLGKQCEVNLFREVEGRSVDRVLEFRLDGEKVGKLSLLLPAHYGESLESLAGESGWENYLGAVCMLTKMEDGQVNLAGTIVFVLHDEEELDGSQGTIVSNHIEKRVLTPNVPRLITAAPMDPKVKVKSFDDDVQWKYRLTVTLRDTAKAPNMLPVTSGSVTGGGAMQVEIKMGEETGK